MNYYPHHIGDFRSGTIHMTRPERWIYRDMIDVYYDTEAPLPLDIDMVCNLVGARTDEECKIVTTLLRFKFAKTDAGYTHERCDIEIRAYHQKAETARTNGQGGGRPVGSGKKPKNNPLGSQPVPISLPIETGLKTNQEPITNNHSNPPIPPKGGEVPVEEKPKARAAISFKTYVAECKAAGVNPIPEDDAVFTYATGAGIPEDFLHLHWREFAARNKEKNSKRYKDWRKTFRNSVRGNWFRLWYIDATGACSLTTQGRQAEALYSKPAK